MLLCFGVEGAEGWLHDDLFAQGASDDPCRALFMDVEIMGRFLKEARI